MNPAAAYESSLLVHCAWSLSSSMAADESQRLTLPLRASPGGYASAELTEDVTAAADFPVQEGRKC